jgi:tRNA-dihydrouridine synthase A
MDRRVSIAPMMDWTDKHCRYFLRLISPNALLYTEMVVCDTIIHGDRERYLGFNKEEHPVALQLGGSDPEKLAVCARIAEEFGYDEVNLNVGCPSERVKKGAFGACLMLEPQLVADCVASMRAACELPVTVKTRIGVDDADSYEELHYFIETVALAGCEVFIVHARKAWLKGLSPKQNRTVPPLQYETVNQLKSDFPQLTFILNGGVQTIEKIQHHLTEFDGVMLGREAYHNPYLLAEVEKHVFHNLNTLSRKDVMDRLIPYYTQQIEKDVYLSRMTRHILGLFHGQAHARQWRRYLSENVKKNDISVLLSAPSME